MKNYIKPTTDVMAMETVHVLATSGSGITWNEDGTGTGSLNDKTSGDALSKRSIWDSGTDNVWK